MSVTLLIILQTNRSICKAAAEFTSTCHSFILLLLIGQQVKKLFGHFANKGMTTSNILLLISCTTTLVPLSNATHIHLDNN